MHHGLLLMFSMRGYSIVLS